MGKAFTTDAYNLGVIQVTEENLVDVARMCEGTVMLRHEADDKRRYIFLELIPGDRSSLVCAYKGNWLVRIENGYKLFTDLEYKKLFEMTHKDRATFEGILTLVKYAQYAKEAARFAQVAPKHLRGKDYVDPEEAAIDVAMKILEIIHEGR